MSSDIIQRLRLLFGSIVSEVAICAIICCLILVSSQLKIHGTWSAVAVMASAGCGVILLAWIVWAACALLGNKPISMMGSTPRKLMECCNGALFIFWIFVVNDSPTAAIPWVVFGAWIILTVIVADYRNSDGV